MDNKIFSETKQKIEQSVASHQLRKAFSLAQSLAYGMSRPRVAEDLAAAEQTYRFMLDYASKGVEDPGRAEMARSLGSTILQAVDSLERENLLPDSAGYYFSTLRYEQLQRYDTIASLAEEYRKTVAAGSMFGFVNNAMDSDSVREALRNREALEIRIFNRLWVSHPLSSDDLHTATALLSSDATPVHFRHMLIWALTLGALEYYDERRLLAVLDLADNANDTLRAAAIIASMLMMHRGKLHGFSPRVLDRLALLGDDATLRENVRTVYLELVKTIDTDRISRKITEEIVPEIMKFRPKIDMDKLPSDPEELEENPEWMDMIEKSGIGDKLKEMNEIQEEGGDVMMGTFAHLKAFSFFNEPANWFRSFHTDYSEFTGADAKLHQPIADMISAMPMLCDSDKFSMMMTVRQIPPQQRDLMLQQVQAGADQFAQIQAASLSGLDTPANAIRNTINKEVQNLTRFYKLFRRKAELHNPLTSELNFLSVEPLRRMITETDTIAVAATFYFKHGYYPEALEAFGLLTDSDRWRNDDQIYQRIGHARQKLGDYEGAVEAFLRAELLNPGSDWTLRRLARALMAAHRLDEAVERWKVLEERNPESASVALNLGRCYLELERYDEAIGQYYKAEYLDEKSGKALRPLAWCLLASGDLEHARKYYQKIITTLEPIPADYLNMGHLALAEGRFMEANNFYSLNIDSRTRQADSAGSPSGNGNDSARCRQERRNEAVDSFIADMKSDAPGRRRRGVAPALVPMLIDHLRCAL